MQYSKYVIALIIFYILLVSPIFTYYVNASNSVVVVTIESNGVVIVELNISVSEGLNNIILPVKPIPETITVVEAGENIPSIYYNNSLIIPAKKSGTAYVRYVANVTMVGGKIVLEISEAIITLRVMKGIVLLSIPENLINASIRDSTLILKFEGPAKIVYTIATQIATSPAIATKPAATTPTSKPSKPTGFILFPSAWVIVGIGIACVLIAVVFALRRRGGDRELDRLDKAILKVLKNRGGRMLQSELIMELGVPKTTLWRHVKKLEKLGYVEIEKVGRVNIVKLK